MRHCAPQRPRRARFSWVERSVRPSARLHARRTWRRLMRRSRRRGTRRQVFVSVRFSPERATRRSSTLGGLVRRACSVHRPARPVGAGNRDSRCAVTLRVSAPCGERSLHTRPPLHTLSSPHFAPGASPTPAPAPAPQLRLPPALPCVCAVSPRRPSRARRSAGGRERQGLHHPAALTLSSAGAG